MYQPERFPYSPLVFVGSVSFLAFSGIIRLIKGSPDHASLFFKTGLAGLALSVIVVVVELARPRVADEQE